jgi:hypothetical protein
VFAKSSSQAFARRTPPNERENHHVDRPLMVFTAAGTYRRRACHAVGDRLHHIDGLAAMILRDDQNKGDRARVVIVALIILVALFLAALLLFSNNESLP